MSFFVLCILVFVCVFVCVFLLQYVCVFYLCVYELMLSICMQSWQQYVFGYMCE